MFHQYLKDKYEFITNYFETAITHPTRNLPHSIILYGSDSLAQYVFALNIAKILNCEKDKNFECNCLNCRWIKENKHPAVLTFSKIDNKGTDDTSKNVISIAQIKDVKDAISTTSNYHRVFIFCDADNKKLSRAQEDNLKNFAQTGFSLPNSEESSWFPLPLNMSVLPDTSANALLKAIEEPPEKVTFIFLAKDKNDLISTIVSRSQSFHIPGFLKESFEDEFVNDLMRNYPFKDPLTALNSANSLLEYINEQDIKTSFAICMIQNYLQKLALANIDTPLAFKKIKKDIFYLEKVQKALLVSVKDQNLLETLFLKLM